MSSESAPGTGPAPVRVLVVDDEPGLADLAAVHLERVDDGFDVATATNARDAVEYLAERDVDCVVSDYEMPGMDGLELLEAVRADHPDLPFVLFTGKGSEEVASEAISVGVTDYMQKERGTDQYTVLANRVRNAVDQRRARTRALEAQERAQVVLENAPDAILVAVDRVHVYANPAAVDVFDATTPADITGTSVFDLVAPGDRDGARAEHEALADDAIELTRRERRLQTVDGDAFEATITVRSITWGGESGLVAIIRDHSEESERLARYERYERAFEHAPDGIAVAAPDGDIVELNPAGARVLDRPAGDAVGRSLGDLFALDDGGLRERLAAGERVTGRGTVERPDGTTRAVELTAVPDGRAGAHVVAFRDVTERVEAEARRADAQDALESMARIIADVDRNADEKLRALLELGTDYLDLPYGFVTHIDDDTQEIVASVGDHEGLRPGEACPLSEAYCRRTVARDELVAVQNAVASGWEDDPAYDRFGLGCYIGVKVLVEGDLYGTFCFAGTEARERAFSDAERVFVELLGRWTGYERTYERVTDRLTERNERLKEFASVVSHDLRSPLGVATGYLDLAREDGDEAAFERVEHALERMDRIIDDLLYLAREDERIGETAAVSLADAARDSWRVVQAVEADATLDVDDDLGTIEADEDRLRQLLENLFRNALDHGGDGVSVRVGALDGAGFYVEDDGPGIPPSERERVFEWGYSGANGSGIGLHTVREVASGHGWDVSVTESESGGARFEIRTDA